MQLCTANISIQDNLKVARLSLYSPPTHHAKTEAHETPVLQQIKRKDVDPIVGIYPKKWHAFCSSKNFEENPSVKINKMLKSH